jgi:hypothetical protein
VVECIGREHELVFLSIPCILVKLVTCAIICKIGLCCDLVLFDLTFAGSTKI